MAETKDAQGAMRWWERDTASIGKACITAVQAIQESQRGSQQRLLRGMKAFGGRGYMSGGRFPTNTGQGGALGMGQRQGPRDNIVYAVVSAVMAQVLDDGPPGVGFLTNHGDWELQHKAELLEQFTDGLAYQSGLNDESVFSLLDACLLGTGYVKHWLDPDNNLWSTRCFPAEINVDLWDGRDRKPRSLHQVGFVDRDILSARYPNKRKVIEAANSHLLADYYVSSFHSSNNLIPFIESWHLPTNRGGSDGRHVLTLASDVVVSVEEYDDDDFPFSVLRYELLPTGWEGMGLADLLAGHQLSLNNCNTAEYWAWSQVAAPRLFALTNSLNLDHLNSSLSGIILTGTQKPEVLNWSGTHPDFVAYKNAIKAGAFALAGVSSMTAAGIKPPGLDSGEAQREYKATLRSRFAMLSQRWQEFRVDCARKQIGLARRAYAVDKGLSVKVIGENFIKEVKLKDCHLEDDEYRLQPKPVSQLPKTLAGQIETATELMQAGADRSASLKVITAVPDLGAMTDLMNAAQSNAERTAYMIFKEGVYVPPDPVQDLQTCMRVMTANLLKAIDNDCPQDRCDMARKWLVQAKALLSPPAPPAAPGGPVGAGAGGPPPPAGGGGPGGAPIAQGMAAPKSSILPFRPPPQ
jgi:hypothetical protein